MNMPNLALRYQAVGLWVSPSGTEFDIILIVVNSLLTGSSRPCCHVQVNSNRPRRIAPLLFLFRWLMDCSTGLHGSRIEFHNTLGGFWGRIVGWWFRATGVSVSS